MCRRRRRRRRQADVDEGEHAGRGQHSSKRVRKQPATGENGRNEGQKPPARRARAGEGNLCKHHKGNTAGDLFGGEGSAKLCPSFCPLEKKRVSERKKQTTVRYYVAVVWAVEPDQPGACLSPSLHYGVLKGMHRLREVEI